MTSKPTSRAEPHRAAVIAIVAAIVAVAVVVVTLVVLSRQDGAPARTAAGGCRYEPTGDPTPAGLPGGQAPAGTVPVTLSTTAGDIGLSLDADAAPCTVNSLVQLAEQGFYDGITCHRLTSTASLQVLQCGDPDGPSDNPGYRFADENLAGAAYPAGTVAMANSGPDTNGSQFFLVYGDSQLPSAYTPFGTITAGADVLAEVARAGVQGGGSDGPPARPVTITDITLG